MTFNLITIALLLGAAVSWPLIAGLLYAEWDAFFPADRVCQASRLFCIAIAFVLALLWPIGLPCAWCLSGFGRYGWRLRPKANHSTAEAAHG